MRNEEEIQEMFEEWSNVFSSMPERTEKEIRKKDLIYHMIRTLDWVLVANTKECNLTKQLEDEIKRLSD